MTKVDRSSRMPLVSRTASPAPVEVLFKRRVVEACVTAARAEAEFAAPVASDGRAPSQQVASASRASRPSRVEWRQAFACPVASVLRCVASSRTAECPGSRLGPVLRGLSRRAASERVRHGLQRLGPSRNRPNVASSLKSRVPSESCVPMVAVAASPVFCRPVASLSASTQRSSRSLLSRPENGRILN